MQRQSRGAALTAYPFTLGRNRRATTALPHSPANSWSDMLEQRFKPQDGRCGGDSENRGRVKLALPYVPQARRTMSGLDGGAKRVCKADSGGFLRKRRSRGSGRRCRRDAGPQPSRMNRLTSSVGRGRHALQTALTCWPMTQPRVGPWQPSATYLMYFFRDFFLAEWLCGNDATVFNARDLTPLGLFN